MAVVVVTVKLGGAAAPGRDARLCGGTGWGLARLRPNMCVALQD